MYPWWPKEALKTQAIAARTYAARNLNKHDRYGFDVCQDEHCQVYRGVEVEAKSTKEATWETRGKFATYKGALISAVYSDCIGPYTENAENVWGYAIPYLVSVDNSIERTDKIEGATWVKTLTADKATDIMNRRGHNVGHVTNIEAIEYTPAGNVLKLKVTGSDGQKIFEKEATRLIFGCATLSQRFGVTGGNSSVTLKSLSGTSSCSNFEPIKVLSADGSYSDCPASPYFLSSNKAVECPKLSSEIFTFRGAGIGHGVGMSQYGAKHMAEDGKSCEEILKHYYTGIDITKLY
jgi:stage II sporulation protein D